MMKKINKKTAKIMMDCILFVCLMGVLALYQYHVMADEVVQVIFVITLLSFVSSLIQRSAPMAVAGGFVAILFFLNTLMFFVVILSLYMLAILEVNLIED